MLTNFNVILVRPQQSGNIGGVARSISITVLQISPWWIHHTSMWSRPDGWLHIGNIIDKMEYCPNVQQAVSECHIVYGK